GLAERALRPLHLEPVELSQPLVEVLLRVARLGRDRAVPLPVGVEELGLALTRHAGHRMAGMLVGRESRARGHDGDGPQAPDDPDPAAHGASPWLVGAAEQRSGTIPGSAPRMLVAPAFADCKSRAGLGEDFTPAAAAE